ncbi:MAG TPA: amino acid ABC transporter permease [Dongiaceae bacterium]|jgi:polar amino acid transport system permease protein|nr:amino acid ABC transporter permease [Dongiaceae bacterium]
MEQILHQLPEFFSPTNVRILAQSMGVTIALTFFGCGLGFLFAFFIVFARQTPGHWALPLRAAAIFFVEIFRRIPFLVTGYLVLFFLSAIIRNPSLFVIALMAIFIYATAYTADIVRGGLESVPRTQIEAAQAMNFGRWRTLLHVIVPQSWPVILPPAMVFMVAFVKDTAVVSQLGVFELAFRGRELNNHGFSGVLVYSTIALLYFAMSYPLTRFGQWLEKRLATPRSQKSKRKLR